MLYPNFFTTEAIGDFSTNFNAYGASAQAQQHVINLPKSLDIRVSDGDTISFRSQGETVRVRLVGIDAPESKQAYGRESGSNLRSCINSGETTQVYYSKKAQYGRLLGKVVVDGRDCNLYQVQTGSAWLYRNYISELPVNDRASYSHAERTARQNRLGLWSAPTVIAPWNWRRLNK